MTFDVPLADPGLSRSCCRRQPRSRPSKSSSSRSSAYSPLSAVPTYFSQCLQITPPLLSPPYEPASSSSSSSASASPSSSSTTAPYTAPPFQVYYNPPHPPIGDDPRGSVLVCHHGGGEGALGFAELAKEIKNGSDGELGVLSWDVRGHGTFDLFPYLVSPASLFSQDAFPFSIQ
jgi:hypothetical protein